MGCSLRQRRMRRRRRMRRGRQPYASQRQISRSSGLRGGVKPRESPQTHLALAQPANGAAEHRYRTLARRPCAVIDPDGEFGLGIGEVPVADLARDLPLMLQARLLTLRVRRDARRGDAELLGVVLDDRPGTSTGSATNAPDEARRGELHREAQPVVIATATTDQAPILVAEEEEALQVHPCRQSAEPPVRARLLIREELDRHVFSTYRPATSALTAGFRSVVPHGPAP